MTKAEKARIVRATFGGSRRYWAHWMRIVRRCKHADRVYSVRFHGRDVPHCAACHADAQFHEDAARSAHKAERKAQLDAAPRCDVTACACRALWTFPYDVHLCGKHKTALLTAHGKRSAAAGSLAMFIQMYDGPDDLLAMASGSGGVA